jgi:ABC-type transporter Mla subunit MlaD
MELAAVLLPIVAFIALAAGLAVVFRGTARIAAQTREISQFRGSVKDLIGRADQILESAAGQVDAVRHHQAGPEVIGQTVVWATEALERCTDEARAVKGPRRARAIRDDLVAELERASRAVGMIEHGANMLATSRRGSRDLEAETSIKRGYLNLIHAREAIARHALRAEELPIDERTSLPTRFDL